MLALGALCFFRLLVVCFLLGVWFFLGWLFMLVWFLCVNFPGCFCLVFCRLGLGVWFVVFFFLFVCRCFVFLDLFLFAPVTCGEF